MRSKGREGGGEVVPLLALAVWHSIPVLVNRLVITFVGECKHF